MSSLKLNFWESILLISEHHLIWVWKLCRLQCLNTRRHFYLGSAEQAPQPDRSAPGPPPHSRSWFLYLQGSETDPGFWLQCLLKKETNTQVFRPRRCLLSKITELSFLIESKEQFKWSRNSSSEYRELYSGSFLHSWKESSMSSSYLSITLYDFGRNSGSWSGFTRINLSSKGFVSMIRRKSRISPNNILYI